LVFFRGTYDKYGDCYANESDGITHVGIVLRNQQMIAAQGDEVNIYPIEETTFERKASGVTCDPGITPPDITKECPRVEGCKYTYPFTARSFYFFEGYRYASEFDNCPVE
jgi:hypothetical protein